MKKLFNDGWKYYVGDLPPHKNTDGWGGAKARAFSFGAAAKELDESRWKNVILPHDFVSEGEYVRKTENSRMKTIPEMESIDSRLFAGGSLEGGVCWYRKHFFVQNDKRILLHFDGVYRDSTIYVNEYYVESHVSGYSPFVIDITDFVDYGGENVIAVRVDASGREGWWYEGGGIYRNVWLEEKDEIYIEPWGIRITYTLEDDRKQAKLLLETEVTSKALSDETLMIRQFIYGNGEIAQDNKSIETVSWETKKVIQEVELSDITLWSLEQPYLYKLVTILERGGKEIDREVNTFGIREISFDAEKGLFLNGEHIRLQGLCCHQDHAGVGIASYKDVWEYRLCQMKSMGMNGFRSAHHATDEIVLSLCDKLGILVLAENRRMSSAKEDVEALRALVKKSRNHPSIFLWSIGNEEVFSQDRIETKRTTKTLIKEIERLDNRPITSAVVCWNGVERFDTAEKYEKITRELDVMGFNYCRSAWEPYHISNPGQPIIITEASANSSTRGCYSTDEAAGQYYIYDRDNESKCKSGKKAVKKDAAENEWKQFAESGYLAGIFLWTGMDYRGEPTPLAYPSVYSHFGIFDYCGFEKDNYYYYKSWWMNEPVLHIFPHWNHAGLEGSALTVFCYSNFDEVELYVNDKSYGKKKVERNWYLHWDDVIYEPGVLRAVGFQNGKKMKEKKVETVGAPYMLKAVPVKERIVQQEGVGIFNVEILDQQGRVVPYANNQIKLSVSGAGELLGTGNGNPGDHDSEKLPVRNAFHGKMQVLIRGKEKGMIHLQVSSEGLVGNEAIIDVE